MKLEGCHFNTIEVIEREKQAALNMAESLGDVHTR
jgi:hypothetical protein